MTKIKPKNVKIIGKKRAQVKKKTIKSWECTYSGILNYFKNKCNTRPIMGRFHWIRKFRARLSRAFPRRSRDAHMYTSL